MRFPIHHSKLIVHNSSGRPFDLAAPERYHLSTMRMIALFAVIACVSAGARGAERVVMEWDFTKATDTLGWTPADPVDVFRVENGVFVTAPGPGKPKMESPLFDIEAEPWQFVQIEMKSDTGGTGLIYYSNTTEEPYHGFRGELHTSFEAQGDNQWHTYAIYPFWHRQGRIKHIRVDPPGNHVEVRAIRIKTASTASPAKTLSWSFGDPNNGWFSTKPEMSAFLFPAHTELAGGNRDAVFLSPPIDAKAEGNLWVTLRLASSADQVALFRWVSDKANGLQSVPVLVRGGLIVRSYPIDLSVTAGWSGRILAVGITPTDSTDAETIRLESVSIGSGPSGPAQLSISKLSAAESFIRTGEKVKLAMEVRNEGGESARDVSAHASLGGTRPPYTLQPQRVATLKPGERRRFEWTMPGRNPGVTMAEGSVVAEGAAGDHTETRLPVYPRYEGGSDRKIPEPVPADTGEYMVGAYYYPGWNTYDRWSVLDDFPERRPVLGYYREGEPEVADWHIKWALDHGISYFIYDWYWTKGVRHLEHALHEGLFNSKYGDKFKFCLLWANHNPEGTSSAKDCEDVTRYWIENYFKRPNYLKISGKNVVVIFSTYRLTKDMGSEAVKASFDKMRRMCEDAGVGGLYIVGCSYPGADRIKPLLAEGYDALSGYNYPSAGYRGQKLSPYEWMVDAYKEWWGQIADASTVPYIPVCEPGWDSRPWHGLSNLVRTGKTPDLWRKMLENAKEFVDDPQRKKPYGKKLVFLEAWNEFGEGDYIEPHAEFGFDYLEAVRKVFAPRSKQPVIVTPKDVGLGPYALTDPGPKTAWDFSKIEDRHWAPGNMSEVSYEGGIFSAKAVNRDPILYGPRMRIDAAKIKAIEIKMKMDKGDFGEVFFADRYENIGQDKSVRFDVIGDGQFHIYKVDLSSNPRWDGTVRAIRIDPNNIEGSRIEVAHIRFR